MYDKRPANNSAFVYFGMLPVDPNSNEARILIPYARGVLGKYRLAAIFFIIVKLYCFNKRIHVHC